LLQFTSFEINKKLGLREIDNLELIEWTAEAKNLWYLLSDTPKSGNP
jgi:hypothetical protein